MALSIIYRNFILNSKKPEQIYSDEISLLAREGVEEYVRLNLRKIISHRKCFKIPVIAIAGSEGKTTTIQMLLAILEPFYNVLRTPPNCSTDSGVTATLLKLNKTHDIVLLEFGIVNPDQFRRAVWVAEPNISVITNIGESHLASMEDKYLIADVKLELLKKLPEDGFAILNIDDDLVTAMAKYTPTAHVIKFGLNKNAHFFANNIRYLGPEGIRFYVNDFYELHMPIYNSAFIYNALTAVSVARVLGMEFSDILQGLEKNFKLLNHRGNLIIRDDVYILDYTYDATINSVTKACESLVQFKPFSSQLILVIGDLTNPGPQVAAAHLKMGYYIAALPIDIIFSVGKYARHIADGIRSLDKTNKTVKAFEHPEELIEQINNRLTPQTTVLFIGSKELKLKKILGKFL